MVDYLDPGALPAHCPLCESGTVASLLSGTARCEACWITHRVGLSVDIITGLSSRARSASR